MVLKSNGEKDPENLSCDQFKNGIIFEGKYAWVNSILWFIYQVTDGLTSIFIVSYLFRKPNHKQDNDLKPANMVQNSHSALDKFGTSVLQDEELLTEHDSLNTSHNLENSMVMTGVENNPDMNAS